MPRAAARHFAPEVAPVFPAVRAARRPPTLEKDPVEGGIPELERVCQDASRPLTPDLPRLMSTDDAGIAPMHHENRPSLAGVWACGQQVGGVL
jgi:hypothetical protein